MNKKFIIGIGVVLVLIIGATIFLARDTSKTPTDTKPAGGVFPGDEATTSPTEGGEARDPGATRTTPGVSVSSSSKLRPISKVSVAGFINFNHRRASSTILRFAESETGNLYEYTPGKDPVRISNTTIPGIQEALWSNSGEYVALRYLDGKENIIKTFIAHPGETPTTTLEGKYIEDNIASIVVAPRERSAAEKFLASSRLADDGGILFESRTFDGTRQSRVLSLAIPEWHVEWPASGVLYFTTSPSNQIAGYTYLYDLARGGISGGDSFAKILGPLKGLLSRASPDGTTVLFSYISGERLVTKLYNTRTEVEISLGIATLADKCAFGTKKTVYCAVPFFLPSANYPDDWYSGVVGFSDVIWEINTETGVGDVLVYPERELGISIDAINLATSQSGDFLYFKDKTSGILWQYALN